MVPGNLRLLVLYAQSVSKPYVGSSMMGFATATHAGTAHLPPPPLLGTQEGRAQRIQALAPGQPACGRLRTTNRSSKSCPPWRALCTTREHEPVH